MLVKVEKRSVRFKFQELFVKFYYNVVPDFLINNKVNKML